MQADAVRIHAKVRPGRDDVAGDGERCQTSAFYETTPAGVEHEGIPEHDHKGAIFFGVPSPEAAPRVVAPEAAEHRADEAEEDGEAKRAVKRAKHFRAPLVVKHVENMCRK